MFTSRDAKFAFIISKPQCSVSDAFYNEMAEVLFKKSKIAAEYRGFQEKWTDTYFHVQFNVNLVFVIKRFQR
jgi:hypothetical protein